MNKEIEIWVKTNFMKELIPSNLEEVIEEHPKINEFIIQYIAWDHSMNDIHKALEDTDLMIVEEEWHPQCIGRKRQFEIITEKE